MQIPFSVRETLRCALDEHEMEFDAKSVAFNDYTPEDIAAFESEISEARAWLESLEGYAPEGPLQRFDPYAFGQCPEDNNGLADDGICGFCGCTPEAYLNDPTWKKGGAES